MIELMKFINAMLNEYLGKPKFDILDKQITQLSECQNQFHLNRMHANAQ